MEIYCALSESEMDLHKSPLCNLFTHAYKLAQYVCTFNHQKYIKYDDMCKYISKHVCIISCFKESTFCIHKVVIVHS